MNTNVTIADKPRLNAAESLLACVGDQAVERARTLLKRAEAGAASSQARACAEAELGRIADRALAHRIGFQRGGLNAEEAQLEGDGVYPPTRAEALGIARDLLVLLGGEASLHAVSIIAGVLSDITLEWEEAFDRAKELLFLGGVGDTRVAENPAFIEPQEIVR